ncbi:IclR family transcriptional regulator [Cellulomonas fimi]|uniref:Transcriptional regulator, IclR family n=1 Tax=Cellulomonas fimi (strain ATCC 484 / DSM 20113 / JCM 1341 / CCUG 24087 / LMG 16345 / NBRC 15513 / NCIMB 8980 / NCTC 7547 / NRS-133) TaxID=590998 RepID=F4GYL0_CELFA|nr:IclR family transcriptional regulator [Cellulomonas fimi]AEE47127.1 transcriptional regulator, IclR family [Cellulomonas fimi ATCC 484]NNH05619.1 IclR family transcriptional regulator [Cellulomonas fimi]VEH35331.1 Negative regulator of allantoin and glyoxylate utilization operons [Cellulomonas fimi]
MQNTPLQERPAYVIESVDNALRLLQMLRDEGPVRLTEASARIEVSRSTAHRLLAMLVYRGFAIQRPDKAYAPGPGLLSETSQAELVGRLRSTCRPHLELLARRCGESVNLMIRTGPHVRFIQTVEGSATLRTADRQGAVMSTLEASGGLALVAEAPPEEVRAMELNAPRGWWPTVEKELERVRRHGFALNLAYTEPHVAAIGLALHDPNGAGIAAFSISMPQSRLDPRRRDELVAQARETRREIEADLARGREGRLVVSE